MILPDINLLVYAYNADAPRHSEAKEWWENLLNDSTVTVGLPWAVITGFIRIMTHSKVLVIPLYPSEAIHFVQTWCIRSNIEIINPGSRHLSILRGLLNDIGSAGPLTTDAHLAAIAIEYQCVLHTNDTDFSRFSGLRWENPLK